MARRRARRGPGFIGPLIVIVLGAGLGYQLFSQQTARHGHATRPALHVATPLEEPAATASPENAEEATPAPEETSSPAVLETPSPEISATPLASPSAGATAAASHVPITITKPKRAAGAPARLAIIIDDCGQWRDTELALIALPIPITMSILPHTPYSGQIAKAASDAGKGVMLHLPMEPMAHLDPGPGKITTTMSDDRITATVRDDIAAVPLARGVNNHEGSKATSDTRVMKDVTSVLADENQFFIDSKTAGTSVAEDVASEAGLPVAGRDVFLDNVADVAATERSLRSAAEIAKANGSSIAIGHPKPTTLAAIRNLIPELEADGITFVLAEDLVQRAPPHADPSATR